MTVAYALALAQLASIRPSPLPAPSRPQSFSDAVSGAVRAVRNRDWPSLRAMCDTRLDLAVYSVPPSDEVASGMLFDDEYAPGEQDIVAFSYRGAQIDTALTPSAYFMRQFAYFSDIVDGSCRESTKWPRSSQSAGGLFNKNLGGPAAWGRHASNAAWRIELVRQEGGWTVRRLVIETE